MTSMEIENAIDALKANSLEIDCVEMTLTQDASVKPIVYEGKGYIRQDKDGVLNFKIFVSNIQNTNFPQQLGQMLSNTSGRIFADSDFYRLVARDVHGRTWKADRIIPQAAGNLAFVYSALRSIKSEHTHLFEAKHSVSIRYFGTMLLPIEFGRQETLNKRMNKAQLAAGGADIVVEEFPDETVFTATGKSPLDADFHTRMDEATKFLTAESVEWRVLQTQNDKHGSIVLTSASARSVTTRMDPPISRTVPGYWQYGWTLWINYLEYVLRTTTHSYWNHCTSHLHNARESSANALDAWAVGLSVAVEGMVELIPFKLSKEGKSAIKKFKEWVLDQIRLNEDFQHYETRMGGMLNMLFNVRVQDRMAALIKSGHVTEEYADAWSTLRNRHVHPKEVDPQRMDMKEFQKIFDLVNKTTTFMYEIIFYLIGYAGPHADYGRHGYPARQYPVTPAAPSSPGQPHPVQSSAPQSDRDSSRRAKAAKAEGQRSEGLPSKRKSNVKSAKAASREGHPKRRR